jgi:hypothetical protein
MPAKTMTKVSSERGAESTRRRSTVPISPLRSAIPIPSSETRTVPRGAKSVKLVTISVRMRCSPGTVSKLTG